MTYGPPLPPDHHFARYLKRTLYAADPTTGELIVDKAAFEPRTLNGSPERELSGNHVEWFGQATRLDNIRALHSHLTTVVRMNLKRNDAFGVATADLIVAAGAGQGTRLEVREDPRPAEGNLGADDSHAVIIGVQLSDALAQTALALTMDVVEISTL